MTRQKCSCMILCVHDNRSDGGWTYIRLCMYILVLIYYDTYKVDVIFQINNKKKKPLYTQVVLFFLCHTHFDKNMNTKKIHYCSLKNKKLGTY